MKFETLEECKKWLDDYMGIESEIGDYDAWNVRNTRILIYRTRKDKPILFKLRIADYGDGWELAAITHSLELEVIAKKMRNERNERNTRSKRTV